VSLDAELLELLSPRRGHFQLESGYHSELWFDLDPLFTRPDRVQPFVAALARRLSAHSIAAICGPQTGGATLAEMLGAELRLPWHAADRSVDPAATGLFPVRYRFSERSHAELRGQAVAIVDDAISAGSAVRGCHADLLAGGARPVALGALFVFGEKAEGFAREAGVPME
jgi:orotate phosphoribosyltransferase